MEEDDDAIAGSLLRPPQPGAQSKFSDYPAEFQKWGYIVKTDTYCDMGNDQFGMEDALQGIGVSSDESSWKCCTAYHGDPYGTTKINDMTYQVDGKTYRVTASVRVNLLILH